MKLYVLTLEIGISSGYKYFLGIYDTEEKAIEAQEKHILKRGWTRDEYSIRQLSDQPQE